MRLYTIIFRVISDDYITLQSRDYGLFKRRADEALRECRNVLHSMADGRLVVKTPSSFSFGNTFKEAQKSINHSSAISDISYWRSTYGKTSLEFNKRIIKERQLHFTRIFTQDEELLKEIVDVLEQQVEIGIEVRILFSEDYSGLRKDFLIVDDTAACQLGGGYHRKNERAKNNYRQR